ncbi:protein kinase family protein [Mucilaginibacter conchicola]|uniref:Protein kinase family protein n=1 Tax=Mucilaginibacter conchicola TaxID=2303333 RepID=A0A372NNP6_9SPHI|nr:protein kinase family protein [Mucilaginibacter conchicola]RFZ90005.1 protein kinase family protein [Mucilaginibacter conchicola]
MANYPTLSDIVGAMQNPLQCFKSQELKGGTVLKKNNRILQYSGGYTTVFPFLTKKQKKVALRCWIADIGEAKHRSMAIANYLKQLQSPYFVDFIYVDQALLVQGKNYPVVLMDWIEAKTLKDFIEEHIKRTPELIKTLAEKFKEMVMYLHLQKIAHGDLQHGNLLVKPDCSLTLIDYDSMYISPLDGMPDSIKGLPGYQHPARLTNTLVHNKLDYFSETVIYLSLLVFSEMPDLWPKYFETEDLLFSKLDFASPSTSEIFNLLRRSKNRVVTQLTQSLMDQLAEKDIKNLLPLEELLVDKLAAVRDHIASKWDHQPNPPSNKSAVIANPLGIIQKM